MKRRLILVGLLLLAAACSHPKPYTGTVIGKTSLPAHSYSCQTGGVVIGQMVVPIWGECWEPENYWLRIQTTDGTINVNVNRADFDRYQEGDHVEGKQ